MTLFKPVVAHWCGRIHRLKITRRENSARFPDALSMKKSTRTGSLISFWRVLSREENLPPIGFLLSSLRFILWGSERALNSLSKLMWCFAKFYLICFFHKFEESILTIIYSFIVKQLPFWTNQIPKDNFHGEKTWKRLSCLQDTGWSSFKSMKFECKVLQGAIKRKKCKKQKNKKKKNSLNICPWIITREKSSSIIFCGCKIRIRVTFCKALTIMINGRSIVCLMI